MIQDTSLWAYTPTKKDGGFHRRHEGKKLRALVLLRSRFLSIFFLVSALNVFLRRLLGLLAGLLFEVLADRLLSCIRWVTLSRLLILNSFYIIVRHGVGTPSGSMMPTLSKWVRRGLKCW